MKCPMCRKPCLQTQQGTTTIYICTTEKCFNENKEVGRD